MVLALTRLLVLSKIVDI